jgi:transcriptional regulator with XRE-family HTH domain
MKSKINFYIGQEIRRRRIEKKLKQRELAELIGVSRPWMSRMENRDAPNQIGTLEKICRVFECKLSDIVLAAERMQEEEK